MFTEKHTTDGIALATLRNEELHTAGLVLETLGTSAWQPQYYAICSILLDYLGLGLDDVFPPERAAAAQKMLDELAKDVESAVKQQIADTRRWFEGLSPEDQETRKATLLPQIAIGSNERQKPAICPACKSDAALAGEISGGSEPRVGPDEIERDVRVLPTKFRCPVCQLTLNGHAELFHAGLGDEYSIVESEDPLDYYGIDPTDYLREYEPDYGND